MAIQQDSKHFLPKKIPQHSQGLQPQAAAGEVGQVLQSVGPAQVFARAAAAEGGRGAHAHLGEVEGPIGTQKPGKNPREMEGIPRNPTING